MRNTSSDVTSRTTPVPTCDAWGHLKTDPQSSGISVLDFSGVSSIDRINPGVYRFGFTNTVQQNLRAGGHAILYTPEVRSETCILSCDRASGSTAAASVINLDISTWRFLGPVGSGGNTATRADFPANSTYVNFAVFCLSRDNQLRVPEGATYSLVPGASAYGISGATYYSSLTSALSKRTATAYGTVVLPPSRSNASAYSPYIEEEFNIDRVEAVNGGPEYDVFFRKPMNNTNYAVILCAEAEHFESLGAGIPVINEYSYPIVLRGTLDEHKTRFKFRIRHIKQLDTNNSWAQGNFVSMQSGLTERIHIMVFGGGTYGQP